MSVACSKKKTSIGIVHARCPLFAAARSMLISVKLTSDHKTSHTELDYMFERCVQIFKYDDIDSFRSVVCTPSVCLVRRFPPQVCIPRSSKMITCRSAHAFFFSWNIKRKMQYSVLLSRHDGSKVMLHGMFQTCLIHPIHIVCTHLANHYFDAFLEAKLTWHSATMVYAIISKLIPSQARTIVLFNPTWHYVRNAFCELVFTSALACTLQSCLVRSFIEQIQKHANLSLSP